MARTSTLNPIRVLVPDEPDQWIEYKPLSTGQFLELMDGEYKGSAYARALIQRVVTAWSFAPDVTPEVLDDLEAKNFKWLDAEVMQWAGLREPEKKALSNLPSPDTSAPDTDVSPQSLDT